MLDDSPQSLRELCLRMEAFQELVTQRLDLEKEARDLQAAEYDRRMHHLNHDREEARRLESSYLSRVEFDVQQRDVERRIEVTSSSVIGLQAIPSRMEALNTWRDEVNAHLSSLKGLPMQNAAITGRLDQQATDINDVRGRVSNMVAYGAGATFVLTILMFVLKMVWR